MSSSEKSTDQPLVADGGLATAPNPLGDPLLALDGLMVVVEALCPTWPARGTFVTSGKMRL